MTELEAYKQLVSDAFKVLVNLNDTFYWGTSDVGEVDGSDIPKIIHIYLQCGRDTLVAYEAIVRGHDPDPSLMKRWKRGTADFYRAKAMLQPLADKGTIMFERWYNLEEKKIERSLFGGQEIIWQNNKATLPGGPESDEGGSISDRRNQLVRRYNAIHNIPIPKCTFPNGDTTKPCTRCRLLGTYPGGGRANLECPWPAVKFPDKEYDASST